MKKFLFLLVIWGFIFSNTTLADNLGDNININEVGSVILIIDYETGDIVDVNQAAINYYGYTREELLSKNISSINILTNEEIKKAMELTKLNEKEFFDFQHMMKNGEIRDVEVYTSIGVISGKNYLYSVVHDVTDKVLIEKQSQRNKIIIYLFILLLIILLILYLRKQNKIKNDFKQLSNGYDSLFNNMKEGVALHEVVFDDNGNVVDYKYLRVNKAFEEITGFDSEYIINKNSKEVMPLNEESWIKKYSEVALDDISYSFEKYSRQLDKYFKINVYSPQKGHFISVFTDISEEKKIQQQIEHNHALFKTTLYSLGDAVISSDIDGKLVLMNVAAEKLTGWKLKDAKGKLFCDIFTIVDDKDGTLIECPVKRVIQTGKKIQLGNNALLVSKDGNKIPIENSTSPITNKDGEITGVVAVFRDFLDKKQNIERITYLSYNDQLTGLYNRRYFEEELQRLDNEQSLPLRLIMLDVNGLKLTNDAFGHVVGDDLLIKVAENLKEECRSTDIISRIGGDEIVILLPNTDSDTTERLVNSIYKKMGETQLDSIVISVSIGFAIKENQSKNMSDLFVEAEGYMYRKKLTESMSMRNNTIQVILKTLNESNEREKIHSEQVSRLVVQIGRMLNLTDQEIKELETAALMHDIGKIAISDIILNKEGSLTNTEFDKIKKHPETGYHILKSVDAYSELAEYVLSHHERWDGKGYPRGLKGDEIPLFSRIISVADAFEAMTANRTYRNAISKEEAVKELVRCSGTQFDPDIVKFCFTFCWEQS